METVTRIVATVRNPPPGWTFFSAWFLICLVAQSWRAGTYAFALLVAALLVWRFKVWEKRRRLLLDDEGLPHPKLLRMVVQYARYLWRRAQLVRRWPSAVEALQLTGAGQTKPVPPLRQITPNVDGDLTAFVAPGAYRADVDAYVAKAPKLAGLLRGGCREVVVNPTDSPGNATVELIYGDPFAKVLQLDDLPRATLPNHMSYGMRRDGSPAMVNYLQSILIGGLTRRGKSVLVKVLIADLMRQGVPTALYVADLKDGIELPEFAQIGRLGESSVRVADYQTEVAGVEKMLDRMRAESKRRAGVMIEQGIKQWYPTEEQPLMVALLDETLPLKGRLKVETAAGSIAYTGAGRACVLWVNTQLGEKAILGEIRDLVPQRISFAVQTYQQTDMILGDGAHLAGAMSHKLGSKVGVGYSGNDSDALFHPFRAANVTPAEARDLARGIVPAGMLRDRKRGAVAARHWLYRAYDDSPEWAAAHGDRPAYIGIHTGVDAANRHAQHAKRGWKWCELHNRMENFWRVHARRVEVVEVSGTRRQLEAEERLAIETELPVFNVMHNSGPLWARRVRSRFSRKAAGHPHSRRRPRASQRRGTYEAAGAE